MEEIIRLLRQDLKEYGPVPFWSWNNKIEKEQLLRQIDDMQTAHCGGFVIHARTGLKNEYLSEEWFSLVELCLEEAKKRGMSVWIYDENGWPSGFAGGKLLTEENLAQYLVYAENTEFDETAFAVYIRQNEKFVRIRSAQEETTVYYTVYKKRSPSNTDILNPAVVEQFIQTTHEEYFKRFGNRFGKEFTGFFTDEPQYFRGETPYAPALEEYFRTHYGEDVTDGLISLFFDGEEHYCFRVRYYTALNDLYTHNYYKRLYDWCENHGCKLTGHSLEENKYFAQMWGSAGVSPSYAYEHVPAIDNLGPKGDARLSARQVGSVAAQTGKRQILTETFGCCGYSATPAQLKAIAEKQYVHGVNMMCHHLFAYSLAGQGKTDHPPCFSRHMTWFKQFSAFNDYFTRLGFLLANSSAQVNCVVISPMSSVYLRYNIKDEAKARAIDEAFERLQEKLNEYGILYELADEQILKTHGSAEGGKFRVGLRTYTYVIVPECDNLAATTRRLLEQFAGKGGKFLALSVPKFTDGEAEVRAFPESTTSLEEIAEHGARRLKTDGRADYTYRVGNDGSFAFLYLVNPTEETAHITLPDQFARLDLNRLILTETDCDITLSAGEGAVLVPGAGAPRVPCLPPVEISERFRFVGAAKNNLTLDVVSLSTDGKTFGNEEPVASAFDRLLRERYRGKLFVRFQFTVEGSGIALRLRREKGNISNSSLNGSPLQFEESEFDVMFEEADISRMVRKGENFYLYETDFFEREEVYYALFSPEATESMRNCLTYDVELENIYVIGDFSVSQRTIRIMDPPASMKRLNEQGFPYFAGEVRFAADIFGETSSAVLTLSGQFSAAEVFVNGTSAGSCFADGSVEIPLIKGKENSVELAFSSTLRNMFGPFHWAGELDGVSPFNFTMRGSWQNDGTCKFYTSEYHLEPFGLNSVTLQYKKI